jgi:antitoxin HicB
MGNALNARQSDRASTVHRTGRGVSPATRVHQKVAKDSQRGSRPRSSSPPRIETEGLNPAHLGSTLEDFLKDEGMFETVHVLAVKKGVAYKLLEIMRQQKLTKDALAKRMKTSRAALDRLLDPTNPSVTLSTLGKVACALGRTLRVEIIEAPR